MKLVSKINCFYIEILSNKKNLLFSIIYSLIFGLCYLLGKSLSHNDITFFSIIKMLLLMLISNTVYLFIIFKIKQDNVSHTSKIKTLRNSDIFYIFKYTLIQLIFIIPVLLAYYPGIFSYDVAVQVPQHIGSYSTHHPLLHTLILQFFYYNIGGLFHNVNIGILSYTLFQSSLFALMMSYMYLFLKKIGINKYQIMIILLFFSAMPFIQLLTISITKDIIYSGFVLMLFTNICYIQLDYSFINSGKNIILYLVSIIGVILFRNNGVYLLCVYFLFNILYGIKHKQFKFLLYTFLGIIIGFLINNGIAILLKANCGSSNEKFSVPYQQIAVVYMEKGNNLTIAERKKIENLLPDVSKYNPYLSDSIKNTAVGDKNIKDFFDLWIDLLRKYPKEYIKAYLNLNLGYWYIFDTTNANIYGSSLESRQGFILTDTKDGFGVEHKSYFEPLENLYEKLFSSNKYQNYFIIFLINSIALYSWIIVMMLFISIHLKVDIFMPMSFIIIMIGLITLGPCSLIRYALPYIICIPALYSTLIYQYKKQAIR